jgi:hypothetical protein
MFDNIEQLKDISVLTDNGYFSIMKVDFDKNIFGNFCIQLASE